MFTLGGFIIYLIIENFYNLKNRALISIFLGMIFATIDEFHQIYSYGRGPKITDVGIDTLGVVSGVFIAFVFVKLLKKISNKFEKEANYDKFQKNNSR